MKRALVVGAQLGSIQGPDLDAARVEAALIARGFTVDLRIRGDATRAGVVAGWQELIAASVAGDAAVFYFAGHGATFANPDPDAGAPGVPRFGQVLVPTDLRAGTDDDFRGITSWELSLWLAQLTARTDNVTVLLDCCHAAQMCKDGSGSTPRALPHPLRLGATRHLAALRDQGARFDTLDPLGNPRAVRLFAAGRTQTAYEYVGADGLHVGAFTEALLWALDQVGDAAVTWATVGRAIRDRVIDRYDNQWLELGGPVGRLLFSTAVPPPSGAVSIVTRDTRARLRAGRIAGVQIGDTFRVQPIDSPHNQRARPLAIATVTAVGATESEVTLDGATAVPDGALAFPLDQPLPREPVAIDGDGAAADALRALVAAAPRLRIVDDRDAEPPMASVRVDAATATATIADRIGPLVPPLAIADADARAATVDFLIDLAVARSLRTLEGAHGVPAEACALSWGVVERGVAHPQPASGALLGLGDRIYVRLDNRSPDTTVYAHVFNVGLRDEVVRLSASAVLGIPLRPGDSYTLGEVAGQGLVGLRLSWSAALGRDAPRADRLYAIATTTPTDLGALETAQRVVQTVTAKGGSPLARLGARSFGIARSADDDGFVAARADFLLQPTPLALASPSFAVDDNPAGTRGALAPGAWRSAPPARRTIAIRVDARALDAADLRLDALVCTRGRYAAATLRLPIDRALVFRGEVTDVVELCLWTSPARASAVPLDALLAARVAADPALRDARAALTIGSGPWVNAIGASLALARAAHDALGAPLALYRTSFLASEDFGIGHGAPRRASDVAFAVTITAD